MDDLRRNKRIATRLPDKLYLSVDQRHRYVTVGGHLAQTVTEVRQPAHHVAVARGVGDQSVLVSFVQDLHAPLK